MDKHLKWGVDKHLNWVDKHLIWGVDKHLNWVDKHLKCGVNKHLNLVDKHLKWGVDKHLEKVDKHLKCRSTQKNSLPDWDLHKRQMQMKPLRRRAPNNFCDFPGFAQILCDRTSLTSDLISLPGNVGGEWANPLMDRGDWAGKDTNGAYNRIPFEIIKEGQHFWHCQKCWPRLLHCKPMPLAAARPWWGNQGSAP